MFHKDTRRSDKFARSVEHFRKAGKDMPTRGGEKEIEFSGYTEFLKSKTTIGPFDIRPHMKKMKTYTHYYKYPKYYSQPFVEDLPDVDKDINTEILFEKNYTVNVAYKYKKDNPDKNICILNFASAKNPGGGFLRGSMAQEESICYVSTLYHSLIQSDMYEINKKNTIKNKAIEMSENGKLPSHDTLASILGIPETIVKKVYYEMEINNQCKPRYIGKRKIGTWLI